MIPAAFDYVRPDSLEEAVKLLERHGDDAKVLAGGHSLLPAMKLRLAQPRVLVDIGRLPGLAEVRDDGGMVVVGALATHHSIASSKLLADRCPLLPEVAAAIGDVQVRNRGTIGGSLAQADPAGDWPAAVLALEAVMEATGPGGRRTIKAGEFFVDMLQTALAPGEILTRILVPATRQTVAYEKIAQKASGFAIAGAAVVIDAERVRVGVTGVAAKAYRASKVEAAVRGPKISAEAAAAAAAKTAAGVEALGDMHASAEFRAHLACVAVRRALERAASRA